MKPLLLTVFFAALVCLNSFGKAWRINNIAGTDPDFTSVSQAVQSADVKSGDTLYVEGSPQNYGSATITKRLVILGTGYFLDDSLNTHTQWFKENAQISSISLNKGSSGSIISGLQLSGLYINDSAIIVERNYITSGIYFGSVNNTFADGCIIRQNFLNSISTYYTNYVSSAKDLLVHNNIIRSTVDFSNVDEKTSGFFVNNNFLYYNSIRVSNFVFQNNIFFNPSFSSYLTTNIYFNNIVNNSVLPADNQNKLNVDITAVYVNWNNGSGNPSVGYSPDGRYKLKAGSPASSAGTLNGTTVDCGAFGGPAPYVLSGMPRIPSIYKLIMPVQVNSGTPTMTVTIGAAAH